MCDSDKPNKGAHRNLLSSNNIDKIYITKLRLSVFKNKPGPSSFQTPLLQPHYPQMCNRIGLNAFLNHDSLNFIQALEQRARYCKLTQYKQYTDNRRQNTVSLC